MKTSQPPSNSDRLSALVFFIVDGLPFVIVGLAMVARYVRSFDTVRGPIGPRAFLTVMGMAASGRRSERDSDRSGAVCLLIHTHQDPMNDWSLLLPFACELPSPSCACDWAAHPFALFACPVVQPALYVQPRLLMRTASVL